MKRIWIMISVILSFAAELQASPNTYLTNGHPPYKTPPEIKPILKQFEQYADNTFKKMRVPGSAIAIIYRNEIIFMKSYGVRRLGKKELIDNDTLFQLGSVSKPVSATLAAILAGQQQIHLDDPLEKYLPNFELQTHKKIRAIQPLKIRNLLNHTTGVPRAGFNALIEAYIQIVNKLQKTPINCTIGHCYDYHNVMFSVIGDVIAAATRRTFGEALKQHLLTPLNMRRTSTSLESLTNDLNKAYPHIRNERGVLSPCSYHSKSYYAVAPAGGVNSTIRDMAIFLQAQMGKFPHIVNKTALNLMHEPLITTPEVLTRMGNQRVKNAYYGLGWRILNFANEKVVFHGGWLKGFNNVVAFLPEHELGIVVLQNAETRFAWQSTVKFFEMYLDLPEQPQYIPIQALKSYAKKKKKKLHPIRTASHTTSLKARKPTRKR